MTQCKGVVLLLFLALVLGVFSSGYAGAEGRPTEKVAPPPQVNPNAVIWRTPEPPKEAQAGDVWVNPKDGMEMVYIAAGEFLMGSSDAEIEAWLMEEYPQDKRKRFDYEQPQCRVNLSGYWMGRTEVTNGQYRRFVQATGHRAPDHWEGGEVPSGLERFPVVFVDWKDAHAYCEWAGGRLPSELEWEKAARGADGRVFPWGNQWDGKRCRNFELITGRTYATFEQWFPALGSWLMAHDPVREGPVAVGTYRADASPYGCLDMAGNVFEWCADRYEGNAYQRYANGDLKPPGSGSFLVLRGGSWCNGDRTFFRCAYRFALPPYPLVPSIPDWRFYYYGVGFRCVHSPGPEPEGGPGLIEQEPSGSPVAQPSSGVPAASALPGPAPGRVFRTPEPPADAKLGDVWVSPKDGAEMVCVPAGEFIMGTTEAEIAAKLKEDPNLTAEMFADQNPQFRASLPGYWIDKCEVTVVRYRKFCRATGRKMPAAPSWGWQDDHPVVNVTWHDAAAYAKWAGKRLPTEMEWEKAARGTDGREYPWGNEWDDGKCVNMTMTVTNRELEEVLQGKHALTLPAPKPVGSYPAGASPCGALDMAGNADEWCADWYDGKVYQRFAKGGLAPPGSGTGKVLRGGAWGFVRPASFRCAFRLYAGPGHRDGTDGFRCVRGLP